MFIHWEICMLTFSEHDIWRTLRQVKDRKSAERNPQDGAENLCWPTSSNTHNISNPTLTQSVIAACSKTWTKCQQDKVIGCGKKFTSTHLFIIPEIFLHHHCRQHPHWDHHHLVWKNDDIAYDIWSWYSPLWSHVYLGMYMCISY